MNTSIIFFVSSMGDGGAQRVISIITKELSQSNHALGILTYFDIQPVYEIADNVKLTCVCKETGSKNIFRNMLWMRKYFSANAEKVVSFLAPFNILAILSCMGTHVPVIAADRNDPRRIPSNKVIRMVRDCMYHLADKVVVQTQNNKLYFGKRIQSKTEVIYNPVSMSDNMVGSALSAEKKKQIVSVGRLEPQKNQELLISAFRRIHSRFPEYQLVIYGEGSYRKTLQEKTDQLALTDCVFFPGAVTDVFDRLKCAELFVLTSNYEGMPNALIEAMCLGLPVISSKVSGATDLINDGENGFLFDCGNENQLVQLVENIIANDELKRLLGKNALLLAEELNTKTIVAQWKKIIFDTERI